ncbi:MAG TPA: XdhC family protein [Polyangiaceae bacterium LLY-WYZ-15_(1-7)]|nr:XdhC family protein [Polyangiaceae bacterium LLY-WYZ-15_(1-7)]HJL08611.1 XdhC family protein [Polyangiaceae bacterium LLY-WYZ-15_(1-7)]HJL31241.1 XdhC family protein [Polyangiaceae bacterium LLY-WYZ-15_(1-7)]HJL37333.1 XdhC family protein [Polyangiaceae bacterium LLY-WYZ-15_(1-7)]
MREVTEALLEVLRGGGRGALATVVRTAGSAPQVPGARLLLRPDGQLVGTVGGGAIEQVVVEELRACHADGRPRVVRRDLGRDLGMCCGGRMEVFVEPIESAPRLIVFGAGHVAKPTAALARTVGFEVVVVDDREELNTEARFPGCTRLPFEPEEAVEDLAPRASDWLLIVTHDHHLDERALDVYARRPHRYIGMIGSRRKVFRVLQRIHARAALPPLERVYAPVGLDVGAVTPEEIAVSIVGELVALRHAQPAAHMRAVEDPRLRKVLEGQLTPEAAAKLPAE